MTLSSLVLTATLSNGEAPMKVDKLALAISLLFSASLLLAQSDPSQPLSKPFADQRAMAAASVPACPPPTTMTSNASRVIKPDPWGS